MVGVDEAADTQGTPLEAAIKLGLDTLSLDQTITFVKYVKLVLPLDGYVFWVKASLVSSTALYNVMVFNAGLFNGAYKKPLSTRAAQEALEATYEVEVDGSLHYATRMAQDQEETLSINEVIFTSESSVDAFNAINPNVLYIATPDDPKLEGIRFAFSARGNYYAQANIYHYRGAAIYADMETQIIDDISQINTRALIVSNSLPIWLALNNWPDYDFEPFKNNIPLYPSFLSPQNLRPPYGTIHIQPEGTEPLTQTPYLGKTYSHHQLCMDTVDVALWGCNNDAALTFIDFVNQYSVNWGILGLTNMPVVRDMKRVQVELTAIAQKKTIQFKVSYYQSVARSIARQLIKNVIPTYYFQ